MDRVIYENAICLRLDQAERIPFREVSTEGWHPTASNCHKNVDDWVLLNPRDSAVRGWVTYASFGTKIGLTAHSVVRGVDGTKFDITPLENEAQRCHVREGMRFVEHLGSDEDFFVHERECHLMTCPQAFEQFEPFADCEEELVVGNDDDTF